MKILTEEWIKKAENDFIVAKRELNFDFPVYDAICFHCQQCVEKYFKAILQEKDIFFEKTHDLDILLERCKIILPELLNFKLEIVELSSFAVEIRYPGTDATIEEASKFFSLAEKTRKIIREYFGLKV